jgi:2,3-bisphosphoglycerate-dependent phosphoglycerate mutase
VNRIALMKASSLASRLVRARRAFLASGALALAAFALSAAQQGEPDPGSTLAKLSYPRTVVLVRHAEKGGEPTDQDPGLSERGMERAKRLAELLGKSGVTHLFSSELQRAQQTLLPLSAATRLVAQVVSARQPEAQLSALDSLPRGALAVVVGHSNTVPQLIGKLTGGQAKIQIEEATEFDRVFVVTQWGPGRDSSWVELRY